MSCLLCTFGFASAETSVFRLQSQPRVFSTSTRVGDKRLGHAEVLHDLQVQAAFSQAGFMSTLETLKAQGLVDSFRQFWITNAISVTASREQLETLSSRPDVAFTFDDVPIALVAPVDVRLPLVGTVGVENGVGLIRAPECWAIGLDGTGSLVCNFDTGVNGDHAALISKYRGCNGGSSASCWFDPYLNTDHPQDNHGHGTHTMGIMVGSDSTDTVGVAPAAQWIAAAVVERGGGIQRTITDLLAAFQWAADPDGNPSTTEDVPDVVNNSWGIPVGYFPACDQTFWESIDNLEAAGVICVFAAGNEGPFASTIRTPADRITTNFNSFSIGAVDGNTPGFPVASFSSRGPSGCDGVSVKPEVTAPGVQVRSTSRSGGYLLMSGTSMAAPHVAGAVAILRQYNPHATPSEIKQALMLSAGDLGQPGEDNNYGWGVIDVRRALEFMPLPPEPYPVLISKSISGDGVAIPGETCEITLLIENIGGAGENATFHLSTSYTGVEVLSDEATVSSLNHGDTMSVGPFGVRIDSDVPLGALIPFQLCLSIIAGTRTLRFSVTTGGDAIPGVATHDNGEIAMSFSNFGQFGLGPHSLNPGGGGGFSFPSGGPDLLRNGSLLLATDAAHVSDGAIASDPNLTDNDFAPVAGGLPRVTKPGLYSDQDGFARYNDSAAENPIGLEITQRTFCWSQGRPHSFVIVEFTMTNASANLVDSLYAGMFCDWDLPLSSGDDDVVGYVDYESLGYITDPATGLAAGTKCITSSARSYAPIDNESVLSDGFSDSEKFSLMTSGLGCASYDAPGNYSHLLALGPYRLEPGESEVVAFSFVAGNSIAEIEANSRESFLMYPGRTDVSGKPARPESFSTVFNYPNPFNGSTVISVSSARDGEIISIFDIAGRLIREIPLGNRQSAVWDGKDDHGNAVSTGVYFARLGAGSSFARKILLLK